MRQLIIARKDLGMGAGKLAAQVAHASLAFMVHPMREETRVRPLGDVVEITLECERDIYDQWVCGIFTKTVCAARNRRHLLKAQEMAQELGLREDRDYFLIRDACLTDLEPEEVDEKGRGWTLTCIGFRPLPDEVAHTISRKYRLYR